MIDIELYQRLTGDSAVAALVGPRVYPVRAPQDGAVPFVRWALVSRTGEQHLDGDLSSLVAGRFQVDCFAASYSDARALADAVRRCLAGWGDDWNALGGPVANAVQDNELDLTETDLFPVLFRIEQDWLITFIDT